MDSEETLKYLQQKYPEDLNENYRCYWWCTSNIDGSALTYYLVLHDKFCETDKEPMICLRAHLKPDSKVGLKQIKDLIFNSDNDNMKKLFNTYKSKRQFVKDFNSVPITSIGDNKTLV